MINLEILFNFVTIVTICKCGEKPYHWCLLRICYFLRITIWLNCMHLLFSLMRFAVITVQSSENLYIHNLENNWSNRFDSCILLNTCFSNQTFCHSRTPSPHFVFNGQFAENKLDISIKSKYCPILQNCVKFKQRVTFEVTQFYKQ